MKDYLKYDDTQIFKYDNLILSVVYTIGHILIAMTCNRIITGASLDMAAADAFVEPIINGFWFFILHKFAHDKLRPTVLAVVYTLGHFSIASMWSYTFLNVALNLAVLDAIIEPILNGFWFFALLYYWNLQERSDNRFVNG